MLSTKKIGHHHVAYYLSYAARGAVGRWAGTGAKALDLCGAIDPEDFKALAAGVAPGGGQLLERLNEKRVPGWDFCFSAPKSVSLAWALADEGLRGQISLAHDKAVDEALGFLEVHGGRARRGLGGRDGHVKAEIAVACFTHPASRELDPDLHTHGIVMNVARGEDKRTTSLDSRTLYLHKRAAGSIYRAELREHLSSLGAIWDHQDSRGLSEMAGFEKDVLRAFSQRRAQIEHSAAGAQLGAKASQVACIATRREKVDVELSDLRDTWRTRAAELGWNRGRVRGYLSGTDLRQPIEGRSKDALQEILLSAKGLTERAAAFTRDDVVVKICEAATQGLKRDAVEHMADDTLARREVVPLVVATSEGTPLDTATRRAHGDVIRLVRMPESSAATLVTEPRYSTNEMLAIEARLVEIAINGKSAGAGCVADDVVEAVLEGRALTSEQAQMVRSLCTSGDLVEVVVGVPGSGKTFALEAARSAWHKAGYKVIGTALSAAAAAQLQSGSAIASFTLDSLLLALDEPEDGGLDARTVVALDEAGMADTRRLARLVCHTQRAGAKLVLTGDDRQLPAVEAGGAFAGLARRLGATRLEANARQREDWEKEALRALREGRVAEAAGSYKRAGRVCVSDSPAELLAEMTERWWASRCAGDEAVLYSYSREAACVLNQIARTKLDGAGVLTGEELVVDEHSPADLAERRYRVGDEIVCLRNERRLGPRHDPEGLGVRNGTRGVVVAIEPTTGELSLRTDKGGLLVLPTKYVKCFTDFGYAWTLHKGQGQTLGRPGPDTEGRKRGVAFVFGADALFAEAALVAASRAVDRTELFVLDDDDVDTIHEEDNDPIEALSRSWARSRAEVMALDELELGRRIAQMAQAPKEQLGIRRHDLAEVVGLGPTKDAVELEQSARSRLGAAATALEEALSEEQREREAAEDPDLQVRALGKAELQALSRRRAELEEECELAFERSVGIDELVASQARAQKKARLDVRTSLAEILEIDSALATKRQHYLDALVDAPPAYVRELLGPPPADASLGLRWRQGIAEIEDWRRRAGVEEAENPSRTEWERALGPEPEGFDARRYRKVTETLCKVRRDLGLGAQSRTAAAGDRSPPLSDIQIAEAAIVARCSGRVGGPEVPGPAPPYLDVDLGP